MKRLLILIFIFTTILVSNRAMAQMFAVKTNLQMWLTGTVSLGAEMAVSPKVSLEVMAYGNFIPFSSNYRFKVGLIQPGIRFWFSEVFSRSFVGVHATAGAGDLTFNSSKRQGFLYGAGFSYGYAWLLSPRWNMEAEVGFSVAQARYRIYDKEYRSWLPSERTTLVLPSKLGLSLSYLF